MSDKFRERVEAKVKEWRVESIEFEVAGGKARINLALLHMFFPRLYRRNKAGQLNARRRRVPTPKGFLIDLLVPADRAEDMLLELQKAFEERWVPKYGARCAKRMFIMHSVGVIIGFWINWMKKHLNALKFFAS